MVKKSKILPLGKLKSSLLKEIFEQYNNPNIMNELKKFNTEEIYTDSRNRVELEFAIGEDAAVIDMGDRFLVTKTDPITFTTDEIGFYAVNVNANDIASMGALPKWFQACILLPESTTKEEVKKICMDIQKSCLQIGCVLTGGHTEVTYGLDRPIIIGSMLGEVKKENLVKTKGGKPGDAIILTKGIPIEGTSIIAREKENNLRRGGISTKLINHAKDLLHDPGISVIKEALLSVNNFKIHSMHDPTEGGLAMGLVEMADASNCGLRINFDDIHIIPEGKQLCEFFNLDPLRVISSGSLLIGVDEKDSNPLINLLRKNDVIANKIGNLTKEKEYKILKDGSWTDLVYSETDDITRIFDI